MNRLKELREEHGLNMTDVADALGFKYMRYVHYEKEERELNSEVLIKFADFYHVSIDYLLCRNDKEKLYMPPLVRKYEKLDSHSKRVVDAVIDVESERNAEPAETETAVKVIPLFPAAAGPGEYLDGLALDDYEAPADSKATFAVRISGDSMEPYFQDGEVVLCQKREPMDKDIAVVLVNGFLVVKQFFLDYNGDIHLLSLNRARSDLDIFLSHHGTDSVVVWGTVIHKPIPAVML